MPSLSFNQWRCALLPNPVYFGLQRLRLDVLQGATQRDALSVAIRATDYVLRQEGGLERVRGFYEAVKTEAPSETELLIPVPADAATPPPKTTERGTDALAASVPPQVAPPPRFVTIRLRHRHSINGIPYGPGDAQVPEESAAELLAQDRRAVGLG